MHLKNYAVIILFNFIPYLFFHLFRLNMNSIFYSRSDNNLCSFLLSLETFNFIL